MKETNKILEEDIFYKQQAAGVTAIIEVAGSSGFHMKKSLGFGYDNIMYKAEDEVFEMFYSREDLHRLKHLLLEKLEEDEHYFEKIKALHMKKVRDLQEEVSHKKKAVKEYTAEELKEMFRLTRDLLREAVGEGHLIEPFSIMHDEELRDELAKHIQNPKELNEAINILTTPEKHSFSARQQEDLQKIAKLKGEEKEKALKKHIEEYGWIKNNYSGSYPLTKEELEDEIKSLKEKKKNSDMARKKEEITDKYKLPRKITRLCERLIYLTNWQDERKENILKAVGKLDPVLRELANRSGIDPELFVWAFDKEIEEGLEKSDEEMLSERKKFCFIHTNSDYEQKAFIDKEAEELYSLIKTREDVYSATINGMCASVGKAIAKVEICKSMKDIANFKAGNVLVTGMTRPEFLPAMKRAAAIVTDEGGITSHAAIVSRELGIPCVIGTKNATKVLKNGDLVEVKANHGQVVVKEEAKR